jgi:ribosomal protein S18 acetylase RimI-like enzyme
MTQDPKSDARGGVRVRPAEPGDYERALALWRAVDAYHVRLVPDVFRWVPDEARSKALFARLVADSERLALVAAEGEDVAGLLTAELRAAPPAPLFRPSTIAYVTTVVVEEARRRRGIGRALMEAAHAWARRRGAARLELSVYAENESAIRFYERLGYRTTQRVMSREAGGA